MAYTKPNTCQTFLYAKMYYFQGHCTLPKNDCISVCFFFPLIILRYVFVMPYKNRGKLLVDGSAFDPLRNKK